MTREQMIDEAVRWSMKPITMKQVARYADNVARVRRERVPRVWALEDDDDHPEKAADPSWWKGTVAERGVGIFPGCVRKIRAEFRRIEATI